MEAGIDAIVDTQNGGKCMCHAWFSFHKTVRGYRHEKEEIPCQDSSISCAGKNYHIAVVADGHGDPACARSQLGASYVVEITEKCLTDFAKALSYGTMPFKTERQRLECVQQLKNTIVSKWHNAVHRHLQENEITHEELQQAGDYTRLYENGERLEHLYGTTLIAALLTQTYLLLLQQGDGRCDVFYNDGNVNQPIPWDERCSGNITTSICDEDAANRFRSILLDVKKMGIIACYLGSDGVEDSYYENEFSQQGTHQFYMNLSCVLDKVGKKSFDSYLNDFLPQFSASGSTDDVSVAGIIDLDGIRPHIQEYMGQINKYNRKEKLKKEIVQIDHKLVSMERKNAFLTKKSKELRLALKVAEDRLRETRVRCRKIIEDKRKNPTKINDVMIQIVSGYRIELKLPCQSKSIRAERLRLAQDLNEFKQASLAYQKASEETELYEKQFQQLEAHLKKLKSSLQGYDEGE